MSKTIVQLLSAVTLVLAAVVPPVQAGGGANTIIEEHDFATLGASLREKRLPLVLMFSAQHCGYCIKLESDFLQPMQLSGDYTNRALFRKLDISQSHAIRDFAGNKVTPADLARRYRVTVTPTVVFLDSYGNPVAPSRVGLTTPDLYGGYLDESIASAGDALLHTLPYRAALTSSTPRTP